MSRKVKVYSNDNVAMVGSLQNYLAQHDIQAEMRNQYASSVMGEIAFFDAWPELWVSVDQAQDALTLLQAVKLEPVEADNGEEWFCHQCRENNPANFELCWHCGKPLRKT